VDDDLTGETTELLQSLIRNACVNDGTPESGGETRNAELLESFLTGAGLEVERFTPADHPDRASLVARIEGSDPGAPALCLMGHTDVVPVNPAGWREDPFGGEVIDGEVWGRGAVDMLNLTASMAVAFRHLARTGFRPKGSLIYFAVADEEAGGTCGAKWMADAHWDAIACDYVLTEVGGWSDTPAGRPRQVGVTVAEKGLAWRRIRVGGTPGHGSMPYGSDNALVKAAEIVRRLAEYRPTPQIDELWRAQVDAMDLDADAKAGLLDPARLWETFEQLPRPLAKRCHALTHTTFSPNVVHGGQKTNTIPDEVVVEVDIRTIPGTGHDEVEAHLREALGPLYDEVEVTVLFDDVASISPTESLLWDVLRDATQVAYPGAELVPGMVTGATDARYFRDKGAIALGAGLFSESMSFESFSDRFHGNNERVDIASLGLSTDLWQRVARQLLG
jgi:acetylornithine deacetylase/succinyl-diaminopimelate desuccinylase-like protein